MDSKISQFSKGLEHYVFNKVSLIISIFLADFFVNVILSELLSKEYPESSKPFKWVRNNRSFPYEGNITSCSTDYNSQDGSSHDVMWQHYLTQSSWTCFKYWMDRFCLGLNSSTSKCVPITTSSNSLFNSSSGTFVQLDSETKSVAIPSYLKQTFQVCLKSLQITIKEINTCDFQCIKDHIFRVFPIVTHSASVYVLLRTPEMRLSYGNSILYYVTCLLAKTVFNVVVVSKVLLDHKYVCVIIGVALQFSWLFSEAWQVVISYQIWKSFKPGSVHIRSLRTCTVRGYSFSYYPIVWALPLLLVIFALSMDFLPGLPNSIRPEFGICRCWFIDERTRLMYASGPAALAELAALVMFLATLYHLSAAKALSTSLQTLDSRRHCSKENKWVLIYMKVSFLTGASYILVTLFALYTLNYKVSQGVPPYIINTIKDVERFRGVEIFYIFVLNKRNFVKTSNSSSNERSGPQVEHVSVIDLREAPNQCH